MHDAVKTIASRTSLRPNGLKLDSSIGAKNRTLTDSGPQRSKLAIAKSQVLNEAAGSLGHYKKLNRLTSTLNTASPGELRNSPCVHGQQHPLKLINAALAKDVYVDTEPLAEYLYYVACDEAKVLLTGEQQSSFDSLDQGEHVWTEGGRIRESDCAVLHAVSVSFHHGSLEPIQTVIDNERSVKYVNFNVMREQLNLDDISIDQFMKLTPHLSKIKLQLGNGENWAAMALFTNEDIKAKFQFLTVTGNRLIEVITHCKSSDVNIGDVITPWNELVAKYKDMPTNVLGGAHH